MTNIKEIRIKANFSQNALAKKAGVSQSSLSDIESGKTVGPRSDTLMALAKALNCTIDELLNDQQAI